MSQSQAILDALHDNAIGVDGGKGAELKRRILKSKRDLPTTGRDSAVDVAE